MFIQVKQITSFMLIMFMACTLSAQEPEKPVYTEADSMQDAMLRQLDRQLKAVSSKLWMIQQQNEVLSDSLTLINSALLEQIRILDTGSEALEKKLYLAEAKIENSEKNFEYEKMKLRRALFITAPTLLIVSVILAAMLYLLLRKYKNKTDLQINALRKYTYDELEDVKASYADEIKRRVKKIVAKFKPKSNKNKAKQKKGSKKVAAVKETKSLAKGLTSSQ